MTEVDTIVLIHGFWVTPRSWERWIEHYERQGFRVLAPAYPGFEAGVESLNADPSPVRALTVPRILDRLSSVIDGLDRPPIIIGHSAGGAFTQILLDRGYGVAGVAINSAPTEGVRIVPLSQLRVVFPVFRNPANRHRAIGLSYPQWRYAFANTFDEAEARLLYQRYAVPASGRILWDGTLANFRPGHQDLWVNYHNDGRAPLLFVSGGEDHLMPPAVQRSNVAHYKSDTVTERREYSGFAHLLPAQDGWRDIADDVLDWALSRVGATRPALPVSRALEGRTLEESHRRR